MMAAAVRDLALQHAGNGVEPVRAFKKAARTVIKKLAKKHFPRSVSFAPRVDVVVLPMTQPEEHDLKYGGELQSETDNK
jgi:hypothetical protein